MKEKRRCDLCKYFKPSESYEWEEAKILDLPLIGMCLVKLPPWAVKSSHVMSNSDAFNCEYFKKEKNDKICQTLKQ